MVVFSFHWIKDLVFEVSPCCCVVLLFSTAVFCSYVRCPSIHSSIHPTMQLNTRSCTNAPAHSLSTLLIPFLPPPFLENLFHPPNHPPYLRSTARLHFFHHCFRYHPTWFPTKHDHIQLASTSFGSSSDQLVGSRVERPSAVLKTRNGVWGSGGTGKRISCGVGPGRWDNHGACQCVGSCFGINRRCDGW